MASANIELVKKDLETLVADAQALFKEAGMHNSERAEMLRTKGADLLKEALHNLQHMQEAAVNRTKQFATQTNQYVHEKPWYAVGISAGIGVLIGMLISRR